MLHEMAKDLKEIKGTQAECLSLDREIRVQQKGDAHFFSKILDAAEIGGRMAKLEVQVRVGMHPHRGEGVRPIFKTFSNPTGNVFSTFSAPKVASQPAAPELTDQDRKDRMTNLFADHFGVLHDAILDQDGTQGSALGGICAKYFPQMIYARLRNVTKLEECTNSSTILKTRVILVS